MWSKKQNIMVMYFKFFPPWIYSEETYALLVEAINTLIVLLSVQMFDPDASANSVLYQIVMTGKW